MSPPADESHVTAVTTGEASPPENVSPAGESSPASVASHPSPIRSWLFILSAGLLAGLVGFGIGEVAPRFTPPDLDLPPEIAKSQTKKIAEVTRRGMLSRDHAAALTYGGLGAVLGMALGVAGGLVRRSASASAAACVAGLVLGGAAGAGSTLALLPSYHASRSARSDQDRENNLAIALMTHSVIWGLVGASAGLALGVGLGAPGEPPGPSSEGSSAPCSAPRSMNSQGQSPCPSPKHFGRWRSRRPPGYSPIFASRSARPSGP